MCKTSCMPRYVALLRGVSPVNAKMADLRRCFEKAGFDSVKTVLSSGNVIFDAPRGAIGALERKIERAMASHLDRTFYPIVRPAEILRELVMRDPYEMFALGGEDKRIVTFLREPFRGRVVLPIELHGARILAVRGTEIYSAYRPTAQGPVFMTLIERTFGKDVTTRTWDTVRKCAHA
jgi:uncharacterized protein (DUF1697 family)